MWPFDKKFKDQDSIGKHRRWLRRWLLVPRVYFYAAGAMALLVVIAWGAAFSGIKEDIAVPAFDNGAVSEVAVGYPEVNYPVVQQIFDTSDNYSDCGIAPRQSTSQNMQSKDAITEQLSGPIVSPDTVGDGSFSRPGSNSVVNDQGLAYSEKYNDYRYIGGSSLLAEASQLVRATAGGTITEISQGADGITVEIDHGSLWGTKFQGLTRAIVSKGQRVIRGETIGYCGAVTSQNVIYIQGVVGSDTLPAMQDIIK